MDILRIHGNSEVAKISKLEEEGLTTIKRYIEDYIRADLVNEDTCSCPELRKFLENVEVDDMLLLKYLRGRKNNPGSAWDTLRRYAENRFKYYPEVFPQNGVPDSVRKLVENNVCGILRKTDRFGRRIVFLDITKWDTSLYSMADITMIAVIGVERFWRDPEVMKNGVVLIENSAGFGMSHAKIHTMQNVLRMRDVFLYSFPIQFKAIYYLHVPLIFSLVFKMTKPLFPRKIRERMYLFAGSQTPTDLYDIAPPEILPTWAGGTLSIKDAAEDIADFNNYADRFSRRD